ncbi:MAG: hypothetical protein HOP23_16910 [Methylococcaceae bacterium]|nr:hypothetical protein [Methylococcaceae bacterium]
MQILHDCMDAGGRAMQDDKLLLRLLHLVHPVLQQLPRSKYLPKRLEE